MDITTLLLCLSLFLVGLLTGTVVTLSLVYPNVGRALIRCMAVVALGISGALFTWPTVSLIRGERLRAILLPLPNSSIAEVGEAYAWSAAFLVAGSLILWLSFRG